MTPVPLSGMDRLGSDAWLVTVIEPLAAPVTFGENLAVNCLVPPDAKVNGVVTADSVNPVPEIETADTATDAPPVFVMVTV